MIDPDDLKAAARDARPSRSALKRQAEAAQRLGERIVALRPELLDALELPETLHDAICEARVIASRGGLARQRQYIGRLMRDADVAGIDVALQRLQSVDAAQSQQLRETERWRDRLLREGAPALDQFCAQYRRADTARIRLLLARNADAALSAGQKAGAARELFRVVRSAFD